jgi:predicted RNA-binding protein associated with RNAse of E/G family
MSEITIIKRDHNGKPVLQYSGEVTARGEAWVRVRATFNYDDKPVGSITFRRGDVFTEWHYADRWYNVFEIYDVDDGRLKGWYCNVTRPAVIRENTVEADDMALDMLVLPDGAIQILDEDEFTALDLPDDERLLAILAVQEIRGLVERKEAPFEGVMSGK